MKLSMLKDLAYTYYSYEVSFLNRYQPEYVIFFQNLNCTQKDCKHLTKLKTRGKYIQTWCVFEWELMWIIKNFKE